MIRSLKSSLLVHAPGFLALIGMLALMAAERPWPARAPVHFDFQFHSDHWGSPWQLIAFPILVLAMSFSGIVLSTLWSMREDGRKRFNLALPLVVAALGAVAGVHFWYWSNLRELAHTGQADHPWRWVFSFAAVVCAASITLEIFRRAIPDDGSIPIPQKSPAEIDAEREFQNNLPADGQWMYFATQRANALRWILAAVGGLMIALGFWFFLTPSIPKFSGYSMIGSGLLMFALLAAFSSLHVRVNQSHLILRAGFLRIRVLKLNLSDILDTRVESFHPLKDFGGWGILRAGNTTAYILRGTRGVRLQTRSGREYVIGSEEPEKLAAALRAGAAHAPLPRT
jgi:hypothetical protein